MFVAVGLGLLLCLLILFWCKYTHILHSRFPVHLQVTKEELFRFLKDPSHFVQVHPSIEKVYNIREEDGVLYFEAVENLGSLTGRKRIQFSLTSYADDSKLQTYLQLKSKDRIAQVTISLWIKAFNASEHFEDAAQPPTPRQASVAAATTTSSSSLSSSSASPPTQPQHPKADTSTPSRTAEAHDPVSTVWAFIQVQSFWGASHMISSHVTRVWRSTLETTGTLLVVKER